MRLEYLVFRCMIEDCFPVVVVLILLAFLAVSLYCMMVSVLVLRLNVQYQVLEYRALLQSQGAHYFSVLFMKSSNHVIKPKQIYPSSRLRQSQAWESNNRKFRYRRQNV